MNVENQSVVKIMQLQRPYEILKHSGWLFLANLFLQFDHVNALFKSGHS